MNWWQTLRRVDAYRMAAGPTMSCRRRYSDFSSEHRQSVFFVRQHVFDCDTFGLAKSAQKAGSVFEVLIDRIRLSFNDKYFGH